jgi:diguanylate cyclase (GGDEF)-like protein
MSFSFTRNPRKIYHVVVLTWVILFVAVMSGIVAVDLQRAEKKFADHVSTHFQQANDRVHINESILEGFTAMISTSNSYDRAGIRSYAQKMLKQYPHIFKFEIVEKVPADKLESFAEYYHRNIYPDFKVKAFSYESDRQWQAVEEAPYHLVIVFMEPSSPESRELLGLDIGSNEFLMRALQKSEQQEETAVSTDPFTLVQGHLAYLLQRPIVEFGYGGASSFSKSGAQGGFVQLVILADTLLDRARYVSPGMRGLLYNPSFSSTDSKGHLHLHEGLEAGWLESRLFPRLSINKVLDSRSQPFVLLMEQQLGWSIISWGKLGLTLLIALITFGGMAVYARLYFRNEMERTEMTARLFHLANHDALTGLANRNLLNDRLNHAISQTARQEGQLAVLFLDLEEFKEVNDAYGHDAGDGVLRRAAERLRACVRAGDTVARLGGDEFVLVLENIADQGDVDHVVEKIKTGFEQPFDVKSHSIILGINIGTAIYPRNGTEGDTLIRYADSSMYEDKRSGE